MKEQWKIGLNTLKMHYGARRRLPVMEYVHDGTGTPSKRDRPQSFRIPNGGPNK